MRRHTQVTTLALLALGGSGCGGSARRSYAEAAPAGEATTGGGYYAPSYAAGAAAEEADYGGDGEASCASEMAAAPPSTGYYPGVNAAPVTVTVQPRVVVEQVYVAPAPAVLTAASVADVDRRSNYLDFLRRHPELALGGVDTSRRVRFRVTDGQGRPINDAQIAIRSQLGGALGRTHADGVFDFFPGVTGQGIRGPAIAHIDAGDEEVDAQIDVPASGDREVVVRLTHTDARSVPRLDLGFVIDVTGSMEDELRYVNREVAGIVQRIQQATEAEIRVGATFYRDRVDSPMLQEIPFTADVAGFAQAMQSVHASGGGDYPEDMNAGLEAAMQRMSWGTGNVARVLVLIADAPPQTYGDAQYTYRHALTDAAERGIRILPVAASGSDRSVEFLFRAMGSVTSSPYVYLTDDSGVGGPHLEADTDRVGVEHFQTLLVRLVTSDLEGHGMHEPGFLHEES